MSNSLKSPANLKQRRNEAKISLEALAYEIDIHPTTLWRWEKGNTTINKHMLKVWDEALNVLVTPPTPVQGTGQDLPDKVQSSQPTPSRRESIGEHPESPAGGTCHFCPEPMEVVCESCDLPLCYEHSTGDSDRWRGCAVGIGCWRSL